MSKKILLVEDEALIAMSEAKMLEKHGFEVVSVYNGEKAIVAVDADPAISLILMDIDLGKGMDGTEAAEEILDRHDIPIVFLTSHAEKEYVDKVKTITGSGYILKNSGEFVLIESIDMALNLFEAKQEALHHLRETEVRESRLNHLNRLLLSVRNVNQIITKETDIHELLDKTCRLLIETSGYKRAWIVLLRDERPEEPYFHAGFSGTFGPMTDFLNSGQIPVCAEAALQSGAIRALVQNTTRCGNCPFRRREPSKACAETEENVLTAKLEYAGKLQGWISVLVPKMYAHNRDDQHLFEEIAMDVSYALQSIGAHRETVETKKLLESVMNAIPDAIGVLEGNFNVIRYNSAGYQLLGKTAAEVDGQKCYELINRAAPCEICAVKKSYATKNIEQFEIYEADLNKWIDLRAYPILDDHGNVVKIIEHFRDITEGKQAEDALRENSKTAHQFFSESAAGAFFMMLDEPIEWNDSVDKEKVLDYVFDHQRISQINKAMLDQYLAREEEFLGKTPKQLFAHDVEHGRSLWWKMFDQGFLSIDSNERRFDGSRLWIVGSYRCMYDEQGRITGHFGTQHDITKLKQAQEKLRMKSSFIDRIAEVSPDIFIIYKRDGEYLDIITTNENNLFLKREEMLGSKIPEVLPETAAATILQGIDDALTTNSLKVVEYELGIDNEILDFEARITPLEEDRVLAHIIDITERKQLEDQLKKSEERFKTIFYNSEVSLWEEDFSEVRKIIDGLKKEGVHDFYRYFDNNPDVVWDLAKKIDVIDINDATLKLYGADTKEVMLGSLDKTLYLTENTYELLRDEFVAIAERRTSVKGEMRTRTLDGEVRNITRGVYISKEKDIKVVAINDITPYKNALQEKDFLMRELNHRIKNNLNMVSSLISLKDVEIDYDLSDLKNRIDAIRLVHEKLHQSGEVEQIQANEYIYEILKSVFSSFSDREVAVVSTVEDINLKPKTLVPLGIVINEIATNAVKYGFTDTEEARFSVDMRQNSDGKHYILTLSNTGNPFPEEIGLESPETMGLQLVSTLVAQLNGSIELQKSPNPVFTIRFPTGEE